MQSNIVYIADDEEFACEGIAKILRQVNIEPQKYYDGEQVLEAYKKSQNVRFIIMDLNMPSLDGFEASKEIRKFEKTKGIQPIKIFGLSADNSQHNLEECKAAGIDDLIVKPVTKAKLKL